MQNVRIVKKYLLLFIFALSGFLASASPMTNFLPLEDGYFVIRDEVVYGASIEAIKPYRQPVMINNTASSRDSFGSTDLLICLLLLGVYFAFTHKKSKTRNIDL